MIQIMFETFSVPSFCAAQPTALALAATGRTTGAVIDCGHGVTEIQCFYDGYVLRWSENVRKRGGHELTKYLQRILNERGYTFTTSAEKEIVRDIKEKLTYVALDFDEEMKKAESSSECNKDYTLPDGNDITIANERFRCPELLFKSHIDMEYGHTIDRIDQMLFQSIMKCEGDFREALFNNIVLAGGSTMFHGIQERLEKEIINLAPPTVRVKVIAPPERKYAAWIGGSFTASLSTFPKMVVTREEYNEAGASIVHCKNSW